MVEYKVAINLARREVMPALIKQMNDLGAAYSHGVAAKLNSVSIQNDLRLLEELYAKIQTKLQYLVQFVDKVESNDDAYDRAYQCATKGSELLQSLRDDVDQSEAVVSYDYWPLPTYDQLLLEF